MTNYFAVIKLRRMPDYPMKLSFVAENLTDAMKEMKRSCHCTADSEISEYELYEVLDKDKYRPVASKGAEIARNHNPTLPLLPAPLPKVVATPPNAYRPYKLST